MKYKTLHKIKYFTRLAFKKPYLILRFLFKRHLGVILIIPIKEEFSEFKNKKIKSIKLTKNVDIINKFYKSMNRDSVSCSKIKDWLDKDFDCFLVYDHSQKPIAGMWVFKNNFELPSLSGRTLSNKFEIMLDEDAIYGAYVIVDKNHRGCGINQSLLCFIMKHYSKNSKYKKILLITGAGNGAYIRSVMKFNGTLIGITEVYNILGMKIRKEIFLDRKEKVWNNKI
ncbi:GNAT family N-acetyltransferase [Clostridium cochlearium]|uniref:GNAT family N-acetyltransferase n=1 Tax=Clostridium cochlearium TaxID=1494 RepID=UPI00156FCE3F|nr:GNAT family N-acetyltransferase [Clostridium cochlearium]MBV1817958.1 hypothetical protein [Bacteroidales bacterium MSK.15.36]MCG4571351.1 hypothetical protein [Clostridium cochlearium]MCG4580008.1 hypothetical protein [Clostridium cochlearium]NSJ90592.1 hypothetical protein [Coprococcus sp. MSK.21.13]